MTKIQEIITTENGFRKETGCYQDEQTFRAIMPYNRFYVWKGKDIGHYDIQVQIRLEDSGDVFLSTAQYGGKGEDHSQQTTISLKELHDIIKTAIENKIEKSLTF
jgi:hypothetical protein